MKLYQAILLTLVIIAGCAEIPEISPAMAQDGTTYFSAVDTIYIVSAGQSNCLANCVGTGGQFGQISDSVVAWNNVSAFVTAQEGVAPHGRNQGHASLGFARRLWDIYGKPIAIVKVCHGGNEIENWLPPISTNYNDIETQIVASGIPRADIFLWQQGEANRNEVVGLCNDSTCYQTKLDSLVLLLRQESWFGDNGIFIAGKMIPTTVAGDRNDVLIGLNADYTDGRACGVQDHLSRCDTYHITGPSMDSLGYYGMYDAFDAVARTGWPIEAPAVATGKTLRTRLRISTP